MNWWFVSYPTDPPEPTEEDITDLERDKAYYNELPLPGKQRFHVYTGTLRADMRCRLTEFGPYGRIVLVLDVIDGKEQWVRVE